MVISEKVRALKRVSTELLGCLVVTEVHSIPSFYMPLIVTDLWGFTRRTALPRACKTVLSFHS